MGEDDAIDEDGFDFRPPPSPDDRLWRHPAELAYAAAPVPPLAPRPQLRRNPWALGFVSVLGSAVLAGSLMFAAGGLGDEPRELGLAPVATLVPTPGPAGDGAGIVGVTVDTERRGRAGNGMVLRDGRHVITSWQLLRADDGDGARTDVRVVDDAGRAHHATVVATDALSDLAILRTDTDTLRPWPGAAADDAALTEGDALTLVGGGLGSSLRGWPVHVTEVAATSPAGIVGVAEVDRALPAVAAGAVAVDAHGRFAGIATLDLRDRDARDHASAVVPPTRVRAVAEQYLTTGEVAHGWLGVEATPADTTRNVALHSGTPVADVVPGSPAAVAGIQAGDVLLRVCGEEVTSIDDVLRVMLQTTPGASCPIDAVRDGVGWHATAVVGRRTAA